MMDRPRIEFLVWDEWNRDHIQKHAVTPDEAAEVVFGAPVVHSSSKGRLLFTGPSAGGRFLTVVAGPVPNNVAAYYVFSARPASRRERSGYERALEGDPSE